MYEAKSVEELKIKHPDAFRIYEEAPKPGKPFQGIEPFRVEMPAAVELPRLLNTMTARDVALQLDRIQRQLNEAVSTLRKPGAADPDDLKKAIDQIEQATKQLEAARAKLRGI